MITLINFRLLRGVVTLALCFQPGQFSYFYFDALIETLLSDASY
jgi:hypothetical protein